MQLFVHRYKRVTILLLFYTGINMTLNSNNVMAAEWSITPRVRFGGEYSDNIYLSTTNPIEVTGLIQTV